MISMVESDGFADLILEELVEQGLTGKELVMAIKEMQADVWPAVKRMIADAGRVARQHKGDSDSTEELFADVMED
jgi:hypothetical protein